MTFDPISTIYSVDRNLTLIVIKLTVTGIKHTDLVATTHKMRAVFLVAFFLLVAVCFAEEKTEEKKEEESTEDKKKRIGTVIGIDLGTTYSWCVFLIIGIFLEFCRKKIVFDSDTTQVLRRRLSYYIV